MWIVRMLNRLLRLENYVAKAFGLPEVKAGTPMPKVKRPRSEGLNINPLIESGRNPLPSRPHKAPPPAPSRCGQCVKCNHVIISHGESDPSGGLIICLKTGK